MAHNQKHAIAILGAGKVGRAVGELWLRAGHAVYFGTRRAETAASLAGALGPGVRVGSLEGAAVEGEIVLLALPYPVVESVVTPLHGHLAGKIVLDATNPFAVSNDGRIVSSLGPHITAGTRMAALLPETRVVRAFTHVMDELLVSRSTRQPGFWAVAMAGDDANAKQLTAELIDDAGYVPVDIGTLAESAPLDPGGVLFPHMFTAADMRALLTGADREPS